ncbi:hypothetical protein JG687_00005128 [Phytophthora cactorum]|uniref:Uncharacterized protein n=1 Tax=Phytophthora cactorum TaxID=29920 RepID=A0A8T1ULU4_9STRA|nr:hypothetical protein JG687_00005128 [Phytophthora cactorum]
MSDNILAAAPPKSTFTPRQVCSFYFKPCLDDEGEPTGYYSCKTCGKCYASAAATGTLLPWVDQKASNRFAWVRWVVIGSLPLSFCESKETRQYTKLNLISVATLMSLMEALLKAVEKTIDEEVPDSFGLIIDGWIYGAEHYLVVYGCYETTDGPRYPVLSLSPVMDEPDDHLNAHGHMTAISRFLQFFGKLIDGCRDLVGDNCSVNKRLANLLRVPLIGCASHRLNLTVREYLDPYDSSLEAVQRQMRKLRTVKQAAQLR